MKKDEWLSVMCLENGLRYGAEFGPISDSRTRRLYFPEDDLYVPGAVINSIERWTSKCLAGADFVFINVDYAPEGIWANLGAWSSMVREDGAIFGRDWHIEDVRESVLSTFADSVDGPESYWCAWPNRPKHRSYSLEDKP